MTDHAKNLADALLLTQDILRTVVKVHGPSPICDLAIAKADEAIAAYSAGPQASGDLVERQQIEDALLDAWLSFDWTKPFANALEQQKAWVTAMADVLLSVRLSRAPQPDTVTEEQINKICAVFGYDTSVLSDSDSAALTAALAVRKKP